jgi:hypothetical protein
MIDFVDSAIKWITIAMIPTAVIIIGFATWRAYNGPHWSSPYQRCLSSHIALVPMPTGKAVILQPRKVCDQHSDDFFIDRGDRTFRLVEVESAN